MTPRGQKRAEALAGAAVEFDADGVVGQARAAVFAGHFAAEDRADGAVDVPHRERQLDGLPALERGSAGGKKRRDVERLRDAVVLLGRATDGRTGLNRRLMEDVGEIKTLGLEVFDRAILFEQVTAADHLVDRAEAELGHDFADFLGDEAEEVDHVFGFAGELRAELGVLGRDADGTGVKMADAHHDAAHDDQRRGGEPEFLRAQERGDGDVAAGLQLTVGLHDDAVAQTIQHKRLLRLGKAEFPRNAGMLERGQRARAGAAIVAGDQDDVAVRLGDARRDRAHADLGHELHIDARAGISVLEVVDQLGEVFDGIDVVVRRRADQADAGGAEAHLRDPWPNLVAGKLAALRQAWLLAPF